MSKDLYCRHNRQVLECPECMRLLPVSVWHELSWEGRTLAPNTYYVTMLTSCPLLQYWDVKKPEVAKDTVEGAWAKKRGYYLHYFDKAFGWHELSVHSIVKYRSQELLVLGRIDAYNPQLQTLYEIKTTAWASWQLEKRKSIPRKYDIQQVQCYATMLKAYRLPVKRLVLVYIDYLEICPIEVKFENRTAWIRQRVLSLHNGITRDKPPEPETSWFCTKCPYLSICSAGREYVQALNHKK